MFQRSLFAPVVVGFWCLTTGWLVVAKILPTLNPGVPPGNQALYVAGNQFLPVGWTVLWNDQPVGWALTEARGTSAGGLVVESRVHFDRLPLGEMLPAWARLLVRDAVASAGETRFDARGRLSIDAAGTLRAFTSVVNLPGAFDQIVLNGTIEGDEARVAIHMGDARYETTRHIPAGMLVGDELSPQASLPGLFPGRRWAVPVYSPLRPGPGTMEILHAEVGPVETMACEGDLVRGHVVTFREDPTGPGEPRCRMWVQTGGRVLRQEAAILGARMTFLRRTDADAARLATEEGGGPAAAEFPPTPEPR